MLTKHKYISHKEVRCEECDKSYSRAVYIRHMRTVHVDKSNRTFKCDLCPYTSHAARYDYFFTVFLLCSFLKKSGIIDTQIQLNKGMCGCYFCILEPKTPF